MKKFNLISFALFGITTFSSCAIPGMVSNPNNSYPQSVTESHTKTTLVSPPSYAAAYLPPAQIYQSAPQAQQMQSPLYQASPVCAPQTQQYYQADNSSQYGYAPANVRYNQVGTAQSAQQYIVVQPVPISQSMQLQAPARADVCEVK